MSKTDYISRKAAIEALGEEPLGWADTDAELQAMRDWEQFKATIESIPAADVKPVVHGEWIWNEYKRWWECDQCGEKTTDACMGTPRANYCPWCGADMRKEANDE